MKTTVKKSKTRRSFWTFVLFFSFSVLLAIVIFSVLYKTGYMKNAGENKIIFGFTVPGDPISLLIIASCFVFFFGGLGIFAARRLFFSSLRYSSEILQSIDDTVEDFWEGLGDAVFPTKFHESEIPKREEESPLLKKSQEKGIDFSFFKNS